MVQRIALLLGSVAAAAVLTVALAAAGFAPGATIQPSDPPVATSPAQDLVVAADQATPEPTVQVDTVYVAPAATPKVIRVTKTAKPAATLPPIVIHKVVKVPAGGGENESESEGQDD